MHLFLRDLIKDTLWLITMESQRKDRRRKKPSARRYSNPQPHDHKSRGKCSTAALQPLPNLASFLHFWSQGIWQTVHVNSDWTFLHRSVVFISGFFSQQEGVLGRYHHCLATVHLRVPLTQTTVDTRSIFKDSQAAPKSEWVAMLKNRKSRNRISKFLDFFDN